MIFSEWRSLGDCYNIVAMVVVLEDGAVIPLLDLCFKIVIYNFIDRRRH